MPRGPKGEKRPADVIGNAVHVMRISAGEIEESENQVKAAASRYPGDAGQTFGSALVVG